MWTIFNAEGRATTNSDFEPNHEDLLTRGEQAVFHEEKIALFEALLVDGIVKRKPEVRLKADIDESSATITVACEESSITEIPLTISSVPVTKPVGAFIINGEPGVKLTVDFDRTRFRGDAVEVSF